MGRHRSSRVAASNVDRHPVSLALLFPGQGSQFPGMGRDLAASYPEAARVFERADDILGFPLSRLAWEGPEDQLLQTHNAQPAILVHSLATLAVLRPRLGPVDCAAGHSLGELSAHAAAGTLGFEDAVHAVRRRGELMREAGRARPGAMAAILGLGEPEVREVCRGVSGKGLVCVPANFNAPAQIVVSGDAGAIGEVLVRAREAGARRALRLAVSGAFHSPLMAAAEEGLRKCFRSLSFGPPEFPVFSNVTAGAVRDPGLARRLLVRQLTSPVLWSQSVRAMVESGVERFVEIGPGSVLCGLSRRNARGVSAVCVGTAKGVRKLFPDPVAAGSGS